MQKELREETLKDGEYILSRNATVIVNKDGEIAWIDNDSFTYLKHEV